MKEEKKKQTLKEDDENWKFDFDFSEYGEDDTLTEESEVGESKPMVTGFRARFTNWEQTYQNLGIVERDVSMKAIPVYANTQDIQALWDFYGIVSEYWSNIKDIFGSTAEAKVKNQQKVCRFLLKKHSAGGKIEYKVHNNLLKLREIVYRFSQYANLRIEVTRTRRGNYQNKIRQ